ncbi:amidohydrolase [Rhodococcus sp. USK10]|uniref:2-amino-3-carboxymuconate 6-semialdehyde decarboxylase n=1 Tax=Rhodococcus wratislaviensis TaxID=44752 RepID=A0A402C8Y3_RHOWR|nr:MULTISPECIES: amidohydrolase family protein [Rhodococcus]QYB00891.1 amidohydrolase [Rhodococcus sp. USK10]GCE40085.1 2-amino-3-carboxymuconate 6-semialdehyde decarboxylase [Rhodococcus wratislaviensis]
MNEERIDVHQHVLPPEYAAWLTKKGIGVAGGIDLPEWSADAALEVMRDFGISRAILSVSTPGVHLGDDAEARIMARVVNDYTAQVVRDRPDRFGFFATLTLPDVDGAIAEAEHALTTLGADGVVLIANSRGRYLGDPAFDPLMADLDRHRAVVFVHPGELPGPDVDGIPSFAMDFLLDTTRAAFNLVKNDVPRRFPNISFILAHAGGFLPYASHRISLAMVATGARDPFEALQDFAGFYYDTALSASPAALPSLLNFAAPGHVLYGSDWPFAPAAAGAYFNSHLDSTATLDDATRAEINHLNADTLFPRLGAEVDAGKPG